MAEPTYNFPSVEETLDHPAFKAAIWDLQPERSGKAAVAKGRGGPVNIYWEIHGTGPIKLILIMGLAGTAISWQIQTHFFGHVHADKYSVLVLDNRGIGRSDKPLARYTTAAMARDIIEVADHVGWTEPPEGDNKRDLNIMGVSLGGMIAQEIACQIPHRIQSLSLLCTTASLESNKSFTETVVERIKMFRPKSESQAIHDTALQLFPPEFLTAPDAVAVPNSLTGTKVGAAPGSEGEGGEYPRFDCNFQRFQALELWKRRSEGFLTKQGFFCQLLAAASHKKSPEQLRKMADAVGRERILVLHGTRDMMIAVKNGEKLVKLIEPGVGLILEDLGHAAVSERAEWFNSMMDEKLGEWSKM